jgi:hypothetical protein
MQFILNGRTFNTETSKTVAVSRGQREPMYYDPDDARFIRYENVLYRTANGAFFVHSHETFKYQRGKPVVSDSAWEVDTKMALQWIEQSQAIIIDASELPLPDEA